MRYKKDGIKFTCKCYDEVFDIFLPMIGEHNVYDALAAIVAGRVSGIKSNTIRKGLSEFTGTPMRQEIVPFEDIVILMTHIMQILPLWLKQLKLWGN